MGYTSEANELAAWLRKRVRDTPLRQLADMFRSLGAGGKTQWGEYLNGLKQPHPRVLEAVIQKMVPVAERQRQSNDGRRLLEAAVRAEAQRLHTAFADNPSSNSPREHKHRLTAARSHQAEAQATVLNLDDLISIFTSAITTLNERCHELQTERDQARRELDEQAESNVTQNQKRMAEHKRQTDELRANLSEAEHKLKEENQRRQKFEETLEGAQQGLQEAEHLRDEAMRQAERHRQRLEELTGQAPSSAPPDTGNVPVPLPQPWEYDLLLAEGNDRLESNHSLIRDLRAQIGVLPHVPEQTIIAGEVVPPVSADTPDTGSHSTNSVPNPSADSPDTGTHPKPTPTTPAGRKRPRRRRLTLIAGLTTLAITGGWIIYYSLNRTNDASHPSTPTSLSPSPTSSPSINQVVNADLMNRLKEARAGKVKWVIGIKSGQPGLSEKKGEEWVGTEIDYAKAITAALGIDPRNIQWKVSGTDDRPFQLDQEKVDMFVGTYGMSPDRERGDPKKGIPGVIFAGPYFQTSEEIMMERDPEYHSEAQIHGTPRQINSIDDLTSLPTSKKARVCVVAGSSADTYLQKYNDYPDRLRLSDYNLCIPQLKIHVDAVITDATILEEFQERNPNSYIIARDSLPAGPEEYGIGLNRNATDLKTLICKAMKTNKVMKETKTIYGAVPGGTPVTQGCAPS